MALAPGSRLGPYEIVAFLGAGGMGEVYKARDARLDRIVAIKVLPQSLASDPDFRARFDREASTISQLDHSDICALYDVGEQEGTSYLVMQYLEGEMLETRLKKGALPLDQALQYAIQVGDALGRAHRAGIVHRDLKPGNIMLTKSGAKLLDFGLAKSAAAVDLAAGASTWETRAPLTAKGTILGTCQYMAPDQLEGLPADERTDIWALGAVLYEMLTGKRAFTGTTPTPGPPFRRRYAATTNSCGTTPPHPLNASLDRRRHQLRNSSQTARQHLACFQYVGDPEDCLTHAYRALCR